MTAIDISTALGCRIAADEAEERGDMGRARELRELAEAADWFEGQAAYSEPPGREVCAMQLARAERWLKSHPEATVVWERDRDYEPDDYDGDMPEIGWGCRVWVNNANPSRNSLCGITFDGDGYPDGKDYKRVVEAELALELMPD